MRPPEISAIVTVSAQRRRAQEVIDALAQQTAGAALEIVVADCRPDLAPLAGAHTTVACPGARYADGRLAGLKAAAAPVVAFLEDHCVPAPDWATALLEVYADPSWVAVGFLLENANPASYVSRATMVSDYGYWTYVAERGPTRVLSSNNISFRRDFLRPFDRALHALMAPDQLLVEVAARRGAPMFFETRARAKHYNPTSLYAVLATNLAYSRVHASRRAAIFEWSPAKRLAYGLVVSPCSAGLRALRLARGIGRRGGHLDYALAFPLMIAAYGANGLGSALGYLLGMGGAERDLDHYESIAVRDPKGSVG